MKKKYIFIALLFIVLLILFVNIDIYEVKGASMESTLLEGEYVIVFCNKEPEDGNIIVCDTTEIYMDEQYIIKRYDEDSSSYGLYVVGDNEMDSVDSRTFGELPKYSFKGVAVLSFSLDRGIKILL